MATIANLKVILDGIENQTMGIESAIGGDIYIFSSDFPDYHECMLSSRMMKLKIKMINPGSHHSTCDIHLSLP